MKRSASQPVHLPTLMPRHVRRRWELLPPQEQARWQAEWDLVAAVPRGTLIAAVLGVLHNLRLALNRPGPQLGPLLRWVQRTVERRWLFLKVVVELVIIAAAMWLMGHMATWACAACGW